MLPLAVACCGGIVTAALRLTLPPPMLGCRLVRSPLPSPPPPLFFLFLFYLVAAHPHFPSEIWRRRLQDFVACRISLLPTRTHQNHDMIGRELASFSGREVFSEERVTQTFKFLRTHFAYRSKTSNNSCCAGGSPRHNVDTNTTRSAEARAASRYRYATAWSQ